jgi:hypothetical protein
MRRCRNGACGPHGPPFGAVLPPSGHLNRRRSRPSIAEISTSTFVADTGEESLPRRPRPSKGPRISCREAQGHDSRYRSRNVQRRGDTDGKSHCRQHEDLLQHLDLSPNLRQAVKSRKSSNGGVDSWDCLDGSSPKRLNWLPFSKLEQGSSAAEVARAFEVNPNVLHRWRREFRRGPGNAFPGVGKRRWDETKVAQLTRHPEATNVHAAQAHRLRRWRCCSRTLHKGLFWGRCGRS